MSIDLLGANRELFYVNLTEVGTESQNGNQKFCSAKQQYRDAPLLHDQSKYLVAATRWQIPTSEVPTIEEHYFEVWQYELEAKPGYGPPASISDIADLEAGYMNAVANGTAFTDNGGGNLTYLNQWQHFNLLRRVDLPAAYTIYQWFEQLQATLDEEMHAHAQFHEPVVNVSSFDDTGVETIIHYDGGYHYTKLSDRIKFVLLPDMRVQVWVSFGDFRSDIGFNRTYAKEWYIKMSRGLFDMLQFQISGEGDVDTNLNNHIGYRLFGNHEAGDKRTVNVENYAMAEDTTVPLLRRFFSVATSATSAADSFNCHRKLVLTSDLITKMERTMASLGGRKRQLVEFDVLNNTQFNYSVNKTAAGKDPYLYDTHNFAQSATVTENLPSARTYAANVGVDGRWMQLSSPSPLYQLEVTAHLVIWSYENRMYKAVPIPIPAGGTFDVKLVFVSRDELFEGQDHFHK